MREPDSAGSAPLREFNTLVGRFKISDSPSPPAPGIRVLGIDPGLSCTGYGIIEHSPRGPVLREGGVIRSTAKLPLAERVHEIATGLRDVMSDFQPSVLAIEQIFSHTRHPKTAILMAHARGVILLCASERKLPVIHYSATQIKKLLTGSGRAGKEQIQHAVKHELRLKEIPEPNDVADAVAVGLCHYHSVRHVATDLARAML